MNPLFRATAATLALVGFSDGSSSNGGAVRATEAQQQQQQQQHHPIVDFAQRHLGNNEEYSIGAKASSAKKTRILNDDYLGGDDFVPPWVDVVETTNPPTNPPTNRPTAPPTNAPTNMPTPGPTQPSIPAAPTNPPTEAPPTDPPTNAPVAPTNSPTKSPVDVTVADGAITTTTSNNLQTTSCTYLPEFGNFVTETMDIEYFLYLNDEDGSIEDGSLQGIVDSTIEPTFHVALVNAGLGCFNADFATASHVMVEVSSSGRDLLGADCTIDDDFLLANATECYTVWGQVEATMWFPPRRMRRLQSAATTPFGDREAFNEFTDWMEEALESLGGITIDGSDAEVVKASFKGFVNLNSFDGTNTDLTQDNLGGVNIAAAFMDSGLSADDGGIDLVWGMVAIIAGTVVLFFAIIVMVLKRKRRRRAFREHVRVVEDLALDSKDDLDNNADYVDDDSLFKEDKPLPKEFQVKLESADHDYRWIGEERQKSPIFVATERNKEFHDHLATLKRKKEQEIRERNYESAML